MGKKKNPNGIAVDIRTLVMSAGGKKIYANELLEIWRKVSVLLYDGSKGNEPMFFDGSSGIFVDISQLTQKEIDEIFNKLSKNDKENK